MAKKRAKKPIRRKKCKAQSVSVSATGKGHFLLYLIDGEWDDVHIGQGGTLRIGAKAMVDALTMTGDGRGSTCEWEGIEVEPGEMVGAFLPPSGGIRSISVIDGVKSSKRERRLRARAGRVLAGSGPAPARNVKG